MSSKTKMVGLTLAAAAAISFATAPLSSAIAASKNTKVPCYGVNACKGKGQCKSSTDGCKGKDACKGKNACKGKGMSMKTRKECRKMGGSLKAD